MTPPLKAGSRPSKASHPGFENLSYTAEQLDALEKLKDKTFDEGIAKKAYANHVLCPDGTLLEDTKKLIPALQRRAKELLEEAAAIEVPFGTEEADAEYQRQQSLMDQAQRVRLELRHLQDHIDQKRFLFIVDEHFVPQVYFQCATPDNPDLPAKKKKE